MFLLFNFIKKEHTNNFNAIEIKMKISILWILLMQIFLYFFSFFWTSTKSILIQKNEIETYRIHSTDARHDGTDGSYVSRCANASDDAATVPVIDSGACISWPPSAITNHLSVNKQIFFLINFFFIILLFLL